MTYLVLLSLTKPFQQNGTLTMGRIFGFITLLSMLLLVTPWEEILNRKLKPHPLKETIPTELCIKGVMYYSHRGGMSVAISRSNQVIECNYDS